MRCGFLWGDSDRGEDKSVGDMELRGDIGSGGDMLEIDVSPRDIPRNLSTREVSENSENEIKS